MNDRDHTELLDLLDRHLDPLVPPGPAPVGDLVRRGRARRTRRRGVVAAVGAAAAVAAVAAAVTVTGPATRSAPVAPADSAASSAFAGGSRLVGFDGVVVTVPIDWVACPTAVALAFAPPAADGGCDRSSLVTLGPSGLAGADDAAVLNGLRIVRTDTCPTDDCRWDHTAVVRALDPSVAVTVGSTSRSLVEAVADSVRPVPRGFGVVPPVDFPADQGEVCGAVARAGLRMRDFCNAYFVGEVTALDPPPGTVVPLVHAVDPVPAAAD